MNRKTAGLSTVVGDEGGSKPRRREARADPDSVGTWQIILQKKSKKILSSLGTEATEIDFQRDWGNIDFKIENQKRWRINNELKELIKKYIL